MSKKKRNKNKKQQFVQQKKGGNKFLVWAAVAFAFAIAIVVVIITSGGSGGGGTAVAGLKKVTGPQSYTSNLEMTDVKAIVENGKLAFSLDDVKNSKLIAFSYSGNKVETGFGQQDLPMVAYINQDGQLVTAVAMCEPCKSIKFHFESDGTITCNTCGTKWNIKDLSPVSGACTQYAPDRVKYEVQGNKVLIDESEIKNWKSRV